MSKPLYEYEVEIKQVIHKMFIVDAIDAESAQEEAYEQFHLEKDGDVDTDVISCEMMWAGEEPTEAEKARQEADARQEEFDFVMDTFVSVRAPKGTNPDDLIMDAKLRFQDVVKTINFDVAIKEDV